MLDSNLLREYNKKYNKNISNKKECVARIAELEKKKEKSKRDKEEIIFLNKLKDSDKRKSSENELIEVLNTTILDISETNANSLKLLAENFKLSEKEKQNTNKKNDYNVSLKSLKNSPDFIKCHKLPVYSISSLWGFYTLVITTDFDSFFKNKNLNFLLSDEVKFVAWFIFTVIMCNILFINHYYKKNLEQWTSSLNTKRNRKRLFEEFYSSIEKQQNIGYFTIDELCDFISNKLEFEFSSILFLFMNSLILSILLIYIKYNYYYYINSLVNFLSIFLSIFLFLFAYSIFFTKMLNKFSFLHYKQSKELIKSMNEYKIKRSEQFQTAIESTASLIISEYINTGILKQKNNGIEVIYILKG